MTARRHRCLCCGCWTLDQPPPGSYETCDICGWQDRFLDSPSDRFALERSQVSVAETGIAAMVSMSDVRTPTSEEFGILKTSHTHLALARKRNLLSTTEALIRASFAEVKPDGRTTLKRAFEADLGSPAPSDWDDSDRHWSEIPYEAIRAYAPYVNTLFIYGNDASFKYYIAPFMIYSLHEDSDAALSALNSGELLPGAKSRNATLLDARQLDAVMSYLNYEQIYGDSPAESAKIASRWGQTSSSEIH